MDAFVEAVEAEGAIRKKDKDARGKRRETSLPSEPAEVLSPELQRAIERANEIGGGAAASAAAKARPPEAPHSH